jgi:hypothetical protein
MQSFDFKVKGTREQRLFQLKFVAPDESPTAQGTRGGTTPPALDVSGFNAILINRTVTARLVDPERALGDFALQLPPMAGSTRSSHGTIELKCVDC